MGMGGVIDILFVASGVYLIVTAFMAKKRNAIAANVMLGKNMSENDIQDKTGYIAYMYRKMIFAGVMISAGGGIHLVNDYYIGSKGLTWAGIVLILIAIVIYTVAFMRGQKRYIPQQTGQGRKKDMKK